MQHLRFKPATRSLHPPLRTILATENEIIILLAALQHDQICDCHHRKIAEAASIIQGFIQRLYEQLPAGKERVEGL